MNKPAAKRLPDVNESEGMSICAAQTSDKELSVSFLSNQALFALTVRWSGCLVGVESGVRNTPPRGSGDIRRADKWSFLIVFFVGKRESDRL